jgi:predicted GNAT superfamily acetyltransferase
MIRNATHDDLDALLALNATAEIETSPLERDELAEMLDLSWRTLIAEPRAGFVLAFDETSNDTGQNYAWFRQRYERFAYVDRIVIAPHTRGQRIGQQLYSHLVHDARSEGHTLLGCEVNIVPLNAPSLRFHDHFGFKPLEDSQTSAHKTVRYMKLDLKPQD